MSLVEAEIKMGKEMKEGIMMENIEKMVLLTACTPICDRPLPSGGFCRRDDPLLPL